MSWKFTGEPYEESFIEGARATTVLCGNIFFVELMKFEEQYGRVASRWTEVRDGVKDVVDYLREYKATIKAASHSDALLHYGETGVFQFDMQYDYVRLFLLDRIDYFDEIFSLGYIDFLVAASLPLPTA